MECIVDVAGQTMRFQGRNTLTAIKGAIPAFAMNISFVGDGPDYDFSAPGVIDQMEAEIVKALHFALEKHGLKKTTVEVQI